MIVELWLKFFMNGPICPMCVYMLEVGRISCECETPCLLDSDSIFIEYDLVQCVDCLGQSHYENYRIYMWLQIWRRFVKHKY